MKLVIVESPAKAKTIGKFLGSSYKVVASIGHIRDLPKSKMGVDIENNFEPQYINIRGKGDLIKELKKHAKKADKVFLATDPDREGEAIAWHLKHVLQKECSDFSRIEFNAITKDNIKAAVKSPREINTSMVDAQQARRVLDRIVGYSISPILWKKVRRGLSAGRVQSVATKMICDKEEEINSFIPQEYWEIEGKFKYDDTNFTAEFYGDNKGNKIKIENEAQSKEILKEMKAPFVISEIVEKQKSRKAYPPLITSSLQQEASNKLGFSTKKTMMLAQQLYEGINIGSQTVGLITYMRTDSTRIAPEAAQKVTGYIEENFGKKYLGSVSTTKSKNAQDAHEAIRPSDVDITPESIEDYLTKDQLKLYTLIWKRFVASFMSNAVYNSLTATISTDKYSFKAVGSTLDFIGFLKIYDYNMAKDEILPNFKKGEEVKKVSIKDSRHFTQPPARYTEASLVKAMEELGIGRPSTYSPTISTILSRGYVAKEKKALYPTELGILVNDILKNYFSNIMEVGFTANLEKELDLIAGENKNWKDLIANFYDGFKDELEVADKDLEKVEIIELTDEICDKCGSQMAIKHGRFGNFLACSAYPECENTKPILHKIGVKCPICETGDVIERKTKKLKNFYGCSNYPNCNFLNWNKPSQKKCPKCGKVLFERHTKKIHELKCDDKECGYSENIES